MKFLKVFSVWFGWSWYLHFLLFCYFLFEIFTFIHSLYTPYFSQPRKPRKPKNKKKPKSSLLAPSIHLYISFILFSLSSYGSKTRICTMYVCCLCISLHYITFQITNIKNKTKRKKNPTPTLLLPCIAYESCKRLPPGLLLFPFHFFYHFFSIFIIQKSIHSTIHPSIQNKSQYASNNKKKVVSMERSLSLVITLECMRSFLFLFFFYLFLSLFF